MDKERPWKDGRELRKAIHRNVIDAEKGRRERKYPINSMVSLWSLINCYYKEEFPNFFKLTSLLSLALLILQVVKEVFLSKTKPLPFLETVKILNVKLNWCGSRTFLQFDIPQLEVFPSTLHLYHHLPNEQSDADRDDQ